MTWQVGSMLDGGARSSGRGATAPRPGSQLFASIDAMWWKYASAAVR
jgi:hypothetical protein